MTEPSKHIHIHDSILIVNYTFYMIMYFNIKRHIQMYSALHFSLASTSVHFLLSSTIYITVYIQKRYIYIYSIFEIYIYTVYCIYIYIQSIVYRYIYIQYCIYF